MSFKIVFQELILTQVIALEGALNSSLVVCSWHPRNDFIKPLIEQSLWRSDGRNVIFKIFKMCIGKRNVKGHDFSFDLFDVLLDEEIVDFWKLCRNLLQVFPFFFFLLKIQLKSKLLKFWWVFFIEPNLKIVLIIEEIWHNNSQLDNLRFCQTI